MQNIVKFKNAVVSGVVGVQCARHGFYMPQSIVDLTKGEAYVPFCDCGEETTHIPSFANTDYALSHTLLEAEKQRWIMLSYDIWCQYGKKLQKRFVESFPEQAKLLDRVRGAIPKMHVKNHIESCQQLYAFNYLKYSGETWGENIESSWAEQNQTAGSTKEQNDGHRHDSLDESFGFWNWSKLRQLREYCLVPFLRTMSEQHSAASLLKSYEKCLETLWKRETAFSALTSIHRPELITQWERMDDVPRLVGGKVCSVYEARFKDGASYRVLNIINLNLDIHQLPLRNSKPINYSWKLNASLNYQVRC